MVGLTLQIRVSVCWRKTRQWLCPHIDHDGRQPFPPRLTIPCGALFLPATKQQKQEELGSQAAAVWRFIMDRQLEAPDEFAALQTHRVQLAVARRQLAFVERMAQVRV